MQTVAPLTLTSEYQEILAGKSSLFLDILTATTAEVYFSTSAEVPTGDGHVVNSFGPGFDLEITGLDAGPDRVWVRGVGSVMVTRG